ncbi:MAG: hypothetical protein ABWZ98_12380, partial [Nakamurella sp.]
MSFLVAASWGGGGGAGFWLGWPVGLRPTGLTRAAALAVDAVRALQREWGIGGGSSSRWSVSGKGCGEVECPAFGPASIPTA